jgi:hypothetical protein
VRRFGRLADLYIALVTAMGVALLAWSSLELRPEPVDPVMFVIVMALAGVAQLNPVMLFRASAISVSFAVQIAAYVLFGTAVALWATIVVVAANALTPRRKPIRKILFNFGQLTIATFVASASYRIVGGEAPPGGIVPTMAAVTLSAGAYFLVNSTLTAVVIALTSNEGFVATWRQNFSWMPLNYLAAAVNGAALALAYETLGPAGALVFVLPLAIAWYSFKVYMVKSAELSERSQELARTNESLQRTTTRLEESHVSLIGALLGHVAAGERGAGGSSATTMFHAIGVANDLRLRRDELAAVQVGALFHDVGTIGIPEQILKKPASLTEDEWAEMKTHPIIGANLLGELPNLERIRPIVLAHHERYDGTGYPFGLKGTQIPLAAQIIACADAYGAMVSARPYRPAMTRDQAIAELLRVRGTQLNPVVVDAFVARLRSLPPEHQNEGERERAYARAVEAFRLASS